MVRPRSAKPLSPGSNPGGASKKLCTYAVQSFLFSLQNLCLPNRQVLTTILYARVVEDFRYLLILGNYGTLGFEVNEMGWTGRKINIPVRMMFRRAYCHKCGAKLKKEAVTNISQKGDLNYSNQIIPFQTTLGMSQIKKTSYIYRCLKCNSTITYDNQCIIVRKQKKLKKVILMDDELKS